MDRSSKEPHLETLADVLLAPQLGDNSPMGNITERCNAIMQDIATQGSRFTFCMLSHARPFRVCEHCLQNYIRFTQMYEDLMVRTLICQHFLNTFSFRQLLLVLVLLVLVLENVTKLENGSRCHCMVDILLNLRS